MAGKELRNLEPPILPEPGYNVTLTLDTRLQAAAQASLQREIDFWNHWFYGNTGQQRISSGVVIAMNPKTGEVLAMVSWPTVSAMASSSGSWAISASPSFRRRPSSDLVPK